MKESASVLCTRYAFIKGFPVNWSLRHSSAENAVLAQHCEKLTRQIGSEPPDRSVADGDALTVGSRVADRRHVITLRGEHADYLHLLAAHDVRHRLGIQASQSRADEAPSRLAPGHCGQTSRDVGGRRRARYVGRLQPSLTTPDHAGHEYRKRLEIEPVRNH